MKDILRDVAIFAVSAALLAATWNVGRLEARVEQLETRLKADVPPEYKHTDDDPDPHCGVCAIPPDKRRMPK